MRLSFIGLQAWLVVLWMLFPTLPWWLIFFPILVPVVFVGSVLLFIVSVFIMATLFGSVEYVSSNK